MYQAQENNNFFLIENISVLSHRETCRGSNPLLIKRIFFFTQFKNRIDESPYRSLMHNELVSEPSAFLF